jgi:hypothetical protein
MRRSTPLQEKGLSIMSTLRERISAGRELGVQMTKDTDPEVSWFLAAADVFYNDTTGEPSIIYVMAHLHSWFHYIERGTFGDPSVEEIAHRLISWVRFAMELKLLVADDPPRARSVDPHAKVLDVMQARLAELRRIADLPA